MFLFTVGFLDINFVDVLDILLVSVLLFHLYKLIKGSVALKIFVGGLSIYLTYLVVKATDMELLSEILSQFIDVGVIAAIILFQQEIRKFLLIIGKSTDFKNFPLFQLFRGKGKQEEINLDILAIIDAMKDMSGTNTGALIVISKDSDLQFYADTGDYVDAKISKRLILSIFFKNSPMHDGACLIYNNRIQAARCILPVSENPNIPATMGLRHRAGIGMTEDTNAIVLIVSEETGQMSFIKSGKIDHNLSAMELRTKIRTYMNDGQEEQAQKTA
ncbi:MULTISPECIES: diadenylate cyclase CdaA [unclassified Flammeovirga]|uniref:diadenylate cyclase CdaA n=1 Tax=unclassified Flammeovirga TaxID=2637820 RepID=UPI0005C68CB1|nr:MULTISPECIES: diadenylate cyclase CdaA [unclassified Flammeovirga]MBD0403452.1 TIGR00159 family protein [Flammeovirga sp. EKP202]